MTSKIRYAALLSYDGTPFEGWQIQRPKTTKRKPTIQGVIQKTLHQVTGEKEIVTGSGRTDAGVHALGQACHFELCKKNWDPVRLRAALNAHLPSEIRVLEILPVSFDFHAQKSAIRKQYSYYFGIEDSPLPHLRSYCHWIKYLPKPLDVDLLNRSLGSLVGTHDFKPFQARGSSTKTTIRKLYEARVEVVEPTLPQLFSNNTKILRIKLVGSGFLKQMVRSISGTLIQVALGRLDPDIFQILLKEQDRSKVGPTAPAHGLWLERVWYQDFSFPSLTAPR